MGARHFIPKLRFLGLILVLAGCVSQPSSFQTNAAGTLNSTAQIAADLTSLFR